MAARKAILLFENKLVFPDRTIVQVRVHLLPEPVQGSTHLFKYSLFFGRPGERFVLYDNERLKGDHRHIGECETAYPFRTVTQLFADFSRDVSAWRRAAGGQDGEA